MHDEKEGPSKVACKGHINPRHITPLLVVPEEAYIHPSYQVRCLSTVMVLITAYYSHCRTCQIFPAGVAQKCSTHISPEALRKDCPRKLQQNVIASNPMARRYTKS